MSPIVSIIIPTYNRGYILPHTIESILKQTFSEWELVIVDDGSTDNTKELVTGFHDKRIHYFYQNNQGPSAARNTAFKHAHGDWIAYIDSDNEFYPNYVKHMLQAIHRNSSTVFALPKGKRTLELVEGRDVITSIDDSSDFPDFLTLQDIFWRKMHFDVNGFMHSRQIIEDGFRWDTKISLMEDWDFLMQIGERYPNNFFYVPEILFHYHQRFGGDGLVSNGKYLDWSNAFEYIYQKHKNDTLLQGQDWYPNRVEKYNDLHEKEMKGKVAPPYLKYFS